MVCWCCGGMSCCFFSIELRFLSHSSTTTMTLSKNAFFVLSLASPAGLYTESQYHSLDEKKRVTCCSARFDDTSS